MGRRRVQLVAIDMSAEFRAAIRQVLPKARISVDHWHVIRLANDMVTKVRRRAWALHARRGRGVDAPWRYRKLLTCAGDRLSARQRARLREVLDAVLELAVVWGIKEHVRQLLAARDTPTFQREWAALTTAVRATRLPQPASPFKTLTAWRRELLTFCRTRVTNTRTEAANLMGQDLQEDVSTDLRRKRTLTTASRVCPCGLIGGCCCGGLPEPLVVESPPIGSTDETQAPWARPGREGAVAALGGCHLERDALFVPAGLVLGDQHGLFDVAVGRHGR